MFSHLLVALDGSPAAESPLQYAAIIPCRTITLLTVIPRADDPGYDWLSSVAADLHHKEQRAHAEAYLDRVSVQLKSPGRTVHNAVAEGDPAEQILDASAGASIILMANHGEGAVTGTAYGSVVDRVARHAGKPLLVVRAGDAAETAVIARIVAPLDGAEASEEAAPLAAELGRQLGVPLHLVSVLDPAVYPTSSVDAAARHTGDYLASERERLRGQDLEIATEIRRGTPAAEIIATVNPSDLIVLTAYGAAASERWLYGSVASKLIRSAPAPVLVIRPVNADQ